MVLDSANADVLARELRAALEGPEFEAASSPLASERSLRSQLGELPALSQGEEWCSTAAVRHGPIICAQAAASWRVPSARP
jgi:hypothetical protein